MANRNSNLEFFQDIIEVVEWVDGGAMEDWSETSGNLIVKKLQKEVNFAKFRVVRVEEELSELKREKELLIQKLGEQETEIDKLRQELEREKWETCDTKANTKEMAKDVARMCWKIGDLVEKISSGDVEEDVALVEEEEEGPLRKRNKWDVNGDGTVVATKEAHKLVRTQVEDNRKTLEEDQKETHVELTRTNEYVENVSTTIQNGIQRPEKQFQKLEASQEFLALEKSSPVISLQEAIALSISEPHQVAHDPGVTFTQSRFPTAGLEPGSLILDQLRKEEEDEESTLTLTFHRSSPSPPNLDYPPQQIEFFHQLLGFPENVSETPIATASPKPFPMATELVASPATSTASVISTPSLQSPQIPYTSKAGEEEDNKEIYHAADPSKRHLGYFCLCGLECSTKKTLQFHLQYLQSNTSSSSSSSSIGTGTMVEGDSAMQMNMMPAHYHPQQTEPRTIMKIKKCKRCGDSYTGGKEGLKQHNMLHHNNHAQPSYPSPVNDNVVSHPHNNFACAYCSEIFRTMVQLRLHHKVKHTPSNNTNTSNHLPTSFE